MQRKIRYCVANWKMNFNSTQSKEYLDSIRNKKLKKNNIKIIIASSFIDIAMNSKYLANNIAFAAQNVFYEDKGAYTGEISCNMLKEINCNWVIIGHSERRAIFHEDNKIINKKLTKVINEKLRPILCIGETEEERSQNKTLEILTSQLLTAFNGISHDKINNIKIAYEPVWAIGTGKTAHFDIINDTHKIIRNILLKNGYNGNDIPILYGGSVNEKNAKDLAEIKNVDGFLIGGASLEVEKFYSIYSNL
tara:strand:+ start:6657 stop:7406 length:750 start_codon:yes stop_codon:yes gene_type:complete